MTVDARPALLRYAVGLALCCLVLIAFVAGQTLYGLTASPFPALLCAVLFSVWFGGIGPGVAVTAFAVVAAGRAAGPRSNVK